MGSGGRDELNYAVLEAYVVLEAERTPSRRRGVFFLTSPSIEPMCPVRHVTYVSGRSIPLPSHLRCFFDCTILVQSRYHPYNRRWKTESVPNPRGFIQSHLK